VTVTDEIDFLIAQVIS